MAEKYVSTRQGSMQWVMQRVSAVLLVFLAFIHFGIQHFTSDAVSTGLTVSARLNDPWWQSYYVLFVVLALYHGINGVIGIWRDYNPRPKLRFWVEITVWTLAVFFAGRAVINIASPVPLATVKARYAANGFPAGETRGNPPMPTATRYSFQEELRELFLLEYYLVKHTHRSETAATDGIFAHKPGVPTQADVVASGKAFDTWCAGVIANGPAKAEARDLHATFSSSYEFAVWASHVRRANAAHREGRASPDLSGIPSYDAVTLH